MTVKLMDGVGVQQIGRYRVINIIGEGGMGVVYLAVDEMISRQVAIKMLRAPAGDTDVLARFHREVRSTANLQHKNIVTVYALDDFQGFPYMVMEYLEGQSIANMIASRQPSHLVEKLGIVSQICEGLQFAHDQNVIHRDIKPANILVLKNGTAKIVDFGIARVGHGDTITRTGQIVGSIYWMSPEQISGIPVDNRTDIYSTGVLLFQFLTGNLPFQGADSDPSGTFVKILNDPVPPLSKYLSSYPRELDDILSKAMAKKAEERFQTAEEFGDELSRLCESLKGEMVTEFLAQARIAVEQKDYELARLKLQEILKSDRRNAQANELFQHVRELMQRQQKLVQIEQLRSQAQMALAAHQYEEALECAEQACRLEPGNQELAAFANSIKDQVERVRVIGEALRRGQAALYAGDLQEASNAVEQALTLDRNHTEARTLDSLIKKELEERDRRSKLQSYVEQARRDISNRDFFSALRSLQQAKSIDPTDSNIQELLNWAVRGHEQEKQRQSLQKAIDEVGKLIGEAMFTEALDVGKDARARHPEDQSLAKLCELAERQLEIQKRKQAVEGIGASARRLIDQNRTAEAIESLQDALKDFPGEPTLDTLLAIAKSESERRDIEREEHDRRLKAFADDTDLTDSRIRDRQEVLGFISTLRSGLARKLPMRQLTEIAATLEHSQTSRRVSGEVSVEISRVLSEFRSRQTKWTKDCEEIRQIKASLSGSKNIEAMEALVERGRLLASQYEKDETVIGEWESITAIAEKLLRERDAVASEATALLHTIQDETQFDEISSIEEQLGALCASWRGDPLIANLLNQGKTLAADLRERKEHLVRDLADLAASIKNARSAGQIGLIQEHAKMLATEIHHPDVGRALEAVEKCSKQKIEELNAVLTKLREIAANIEAAENLREIEQYETAAKEYQTGSDSTEEVSELLIAIERIGSVRRREYARTETNLNQLINSAGKASDKAALDLILARARDLLQRYSRDQKISSLGAQLEIAANERRTHLASEAALRSQTFNQDEEPLDVESDVESLVKTRSATLERRVERSAKHLGKANQIFTMAATACVVTAVAVGVYLIVPRKVVIRTIPAGAAIRVGEQSCNSPCTLRLQVGEHPLEATTPGFVPVHKALDIPWFGTARPLVTFSPLPVTSSPLKVLPSSSQPPSNNARILIRTSVPSASIFIDGSQSAVGKTDLDGKYQVLITSGSHQIWAQKAGFDNSPVQTVAARSDKVVVVRFDLRKSTAGSPQNTQAAVERQTVSPNIAVSPPASAIPAIPVQETFLLVQAPAGAEIHINQQVTGHSTGSPLKVKVQPGQTLVDVFLTGYQPYSQSLNVAPGEQANLTVKLSPVQAPSVPPLGVGHEVDQSPKALADSDAKAISELLDAYQGSFESKDLIRLRHIWPTLSDKQFKELSIPFKDAQQIRLTLQQSGPPQISGDHAVVSCLQSAQITHDGMVQPLANSVTFSMKRLGTDWIIEKITYGKYR